MMVKFFPKSQRTCLTSAALLVLFGLGGCAEPPAAADEAAPPAPAGPAPLVGDDAKASYFIGYGVTDEWVNRLGDKFDGAAFAAGLQDAVDKTLPRVDEEEGSRIMRALSEAAQAEAQKKAEADMQVGKDFLAENAEKDGITVLESGLQYEVLVAGDGPKPKATDTVTTHYEGTLIDGTVFDSSIARGEPVSFALNRVIPGWTEALQLMPTGSKWRLFIPSDLAYGPRPAGQIPPNSTLIFEVELLSIGAADEAPSE